MIRIDIYGTISIPRIPVERTKGSLGSWSEGGDEESGEERRREERRYGKVQIAGSGIGRSN